MFGCQKCALKSDTHDCDRRTDEQTQVQNIIPHFPGGHLTTALYAPVSLRFNYHRYLEYYAWRLPHTSADLAHRSADLADDSCDNYRLIPPIHQHAATGEDGSGGMLIHGPHNDSLLPQRGLVLIIHDVIPLVGTGGI